MKFKEEQDSWERKQKPGSTWVRHDGTAVGTNPKTGDRQGFKVDDDHPNGAYMAAAYAEGKPISPEEAQKRADTDKQKAVDDFENWKANLDTDEKIDYKLVGKDEANLEKKLIFFQSPIGKGLIGKNKNDLVEISTPAGVKNFEIIEVKYI